MLGFGPQSIYATDEGLTCPDMQQERYYMHASSDIRIVKCLDGLHYSFEILRYVYSSLHEACAKIKDDQEALIPAIWLCWSFVDVLHRIREIAQALPGLSGKDKELVSFLKETNLAEEYRHYIQHLRAELSKREVNPFPVWGSLSWVDPKDSSCTHTVFIGAQISSTSYSGSVFDTVERKWVSKVCLGVREKSFNFDPIFEACTRFQKYIVPWALSTYKPRIRLIAKVPIVTMQVVESKRSLT